MCVQIDYFCISAPQKTDRHEAVSHLIDWKLLPLMLVKMCNAKIYKRMFDK